MNEQASIIKLISTPLREEVNISKQKKTIYSIFLKSAGVLLFLFCAVNFCCGQGRIDAAYEAMGNFDYHKAIKILNSKKNIQKTETFYAKAIMYSASQNPFYNPDSAWYYSNKCLNRIKISPVTVSTYPTEKEVKSLQSKILSDIFSKTIEANTLEAYKYYIRNYAGQQFVDSANFLIFQLAFKKSREENTWQSYKNFIDIYTEAPQYEWAKDLYNMRLYEYYTMDNSLTSFESFLTKYPESPYKQDAEEWIYKLSTIEGNPEDYENFIKKYPKNFKVPDAWSALYALKTSSGSLSSIEDFQNNYPNYPDLKKLLIEMEQARTFYFPIYRNKLWGYADSTGYVRIEPLYESEQYFYSNYAIVEKNGKFGVINKSGKTVIYFSFDEIEELDNGYFIVKREDKYGVINIAGNYVLKCLYDDIKNFDEDLIAAKKDNLYGFYDKSGKLIIPHKYLDAYSFKYNTGIVSYQKDQYQFIDRADNKIGSTVFEWIEPFKSNITRVRSETGFGLADKSGKIILNPEYQLIIPLADSSYLLVKENKCGFADRLGQIIIPLNFDYSENYEPDGFVMNTIKVIKNKKVGLINRNAKVVLPFQFDDIGRISEEGIPLCRKNKWAMADKKFKLFTKFKYDHLSEFTDGLSRFKLNGKYGLIDATGIEVLAANYNSLTPVYHDVFLSEINGEQFIIDHRGNKLVDIKIKEAELINNNYLVMIMETGLFYYSCKDGRIFCKYEE